MKIRILLILSLLLAVIPMQFASAWGPLKPEQQAIYSRGIKYFDIVEVKVNTGDGGGGGGGACSGEWGGNKLSWPANGQVTSEFGMRVNPVHGAFILHSGIDIGVPVDSQVCAAADGVVVFASTNGGYGCTIKIDHASSGITDLTNIVTQYSHLNSYVVTSGPVSRGDLIALSGGSTDNYSCPPGNSTGPHLHFEVHVSGGVQNPRGWLE